MRHYEGQRKSGRLKRAEKYSLLIYSDDVNLSSKKRIIYHKEKTVTVAEYDKVLDSNNNAERPASWSSF
jgi:hypothetical protein